MRPALVVGNGPLLFVIRPTAAHPAGPFALDSDPRRAASRFDSLGPSDIPTRLLAVLESVPEESPLLAFPPAFASALAKSLHRAVAVPAAEELREARAVLPRTDPTVERRFFLAFGHLQLERALRAPEEVVIALAREEERVERAMGREERAAETFVAVAGSPLDRHLTAWEDARRALGELNESLRKTLEEEARRLVPNLSAVVGPRVAARLVAAAGGVATLARMPSARLQLLGSRRRPSPDRGPRFGLIFRAERMADVPLGRRAAYARSLAAVAAIGVRADASTHRDLTRELVARRDRRVEELRRRRR